MNEIISRDPPTVAVRRSWLDMSYFGRRWHVSFGTASRGPMSWDLEHKGFAFWHWLPRLDELQRVYADDQEGVEALAECGMRPGDRIGFVRNGQFRFTLRWLCFIFSVRRLSSAEFARRRALNPAL